MLEGYLIVEFKIRKLYLTIYFILFIDNLIYIQEVYVVSLIQHRSERKFWKWKVLINSRCINIFLDAIETIFSQASFSKYFKIFMIHFIKFVLSAMIYQTVPFRNVDPGFQNDEIVAMFCVIVMIIVILYRL